MLRAYLGWLPECRGATKQQAIQGGSSKYMHCCPCCACLSSLKERQSDYVCFRRCRSYSWGVSHQVYFRFLSSILVFLSWFSRFHDYASTLDVSAADLYTALLADAENQPLNWDLQGRQADVWKQYSEWPVVSGTTYDSFMQTILLRLYPARCDRGWGNEYKAGIKDA